RDRDRFRRFLAPRRPAEARRFTPADEAIRGLDAHEGEVDGLERGEGHLVRALHRNIGEDDPDVSDLHRAGRANRPGSKSGRSRGASRSSTHPPPWRPGPGECGNPYPPYPTATKNPSTPGAQPMMA